MNDARSTLQQSIMGFRLSQMISVAAKLRLADLMRERPLSVHDLAEATQTHEDSLYRLLRALASYGVFAEEGNRIFRLTPQAGLLRSDVAGSLRISAEVVAEPWMWNSWGGLLHSVQTGETAFDHLYGKDTWTYFAENTTASGLFNALMEEVSKPDAHAVVEAFEFEGKKVVDVAGGQGVLLAAILDRNPTARGVLFNLPHVIAGMRSEHVGRLELHCGDFFDSIPAGGDVYILKNILHDWEDSRARQILARCREAMTAEARLLIIENLVYGPNEPCKGKSGDIHMMLRCGGRNRTEAELGDLLLASGFQVLRVIPTEGGPDLLEASPRPSSPDENQIDAFPAAPEDRQQVSKVASGQLKPQNTKAFSDALVKRSGLSRIISTAFPALPAAFVPSFNHGFLVSRL